MIRKIKIRDVLDVSRDKLEQLIREKYPHVKSVEISGVNPEMPGKTIVAIEIDENISDLQSFLNSLVKKEPIAVEETIVSDKDIAGKFSDAGQAVLDKLSEMEKSLEDIKAENVLLATKNATLATQISDQAQSMSEQGKKVDAVLGLFALLKSEASKIKG